MLETIRRYQDAGCEIDVYPVGKKVEDAVRKLDVNLNVAGSFVSLIDKPNYTDAKTFADNIINEFNEHRIDHVEIIYNHFKNAAVQIPVKEDFLPFTIQKHEKTTTTDYLIEPDKYAVLNELLPKLLRMKIYAALLDSATAEQAARMMAMQIATDNAEDILTDLNVQFNKQRQQSITSELLDIVGGSEALK
jgi:F-type H+-transporting ATPase subunit gamma